MAWLIWERALICFSYDILDVFFVSNEALLPLNVWGLIYTKGLELSIISGTIANSVKVAEPDRPDLESLRIWVCSDGKGKFRIQ